MENSSAPVRAVRKMVGIEQFFFVGYEIYGAYYVVSRLTLSKAITLSQLEEVGEKLREKHRILQLDSVMDWKTRTTWFTEGKELGIWVDEEKGNRDIDDVIAEMVDMSLEKMQEGKRKKKLCWRVVLAGDGKEVLFGAPHHVADGRSMAIVGSDLIRFLNGMELGQIRELGPGMKGLFGRVSNGAKIKNFMKMVTQMMRQPDLGLEIEGTGSKWSARKRVAKTLELTMEELSIFKARCKEIGVSMNSGFVSAMYEVLSKNGLVQKNSKRLETLIAMDARTRVEKGSKLTHQTMGAYIGSCTSSYSGASDQWAERAKHVQENVNGDKVKHMTCDAFIMSLLGKYPKQMLPKLIDDPKIQGRLAMLAVSNLGRLAEIDTANEEARAHNKNAVTADGLIFADNSNPMGWLITLYIATVGENVRLCLGANDPLVTQATIDNFAGELKSTLTTAAYKL
eukprot:Plantae.Rhodophyta-Hildenbrandia_rubra.ctg8104.p1 GENE.Plantae.Rhodophyta-Hildenbrandia_rubra.ctg8104~~Plantae.Rhodophyta-Hildenbrandia_rubra.ctg8104.p1  ORF type:complete len:453 (-),score=86.68 Plantae.Rhodophyta-Hildenbrandia_rubra.ctg8104:1891-3249(-)